MDMLGKSLLIKIAHYYYDDQLTQSEIAERLGMSRQRVNRLIKSLRAENIVKIEIASPDNIHVELENDMERKFKLKRVIIAHVDHEASIIKQLGKTGAQFLSENIHRIKRIGVSWGKTLYSVAEHCSESSPRDLSVVQLVGGTNSFQASDQANEITRLFAANLNGHPYYMYAPVIVQRKELKDSFMKEQSIKMVFEKMKHCDMALVGIGELSSQSTIYEQQYIDTHFLKMLASKGAVGDICFQMFDIDGELINHHKNHEIIGISKDQLLKVPEVVGIAGGIHKKNAIIGALHSGLIDILIIDSITAQQIVEEA